MAKIAILGSRGYPSYYGGFETLVRHLAPFLVSNGHEVVVYGRGKVRGTSQKSSSNGEVITVRDTWGIDRKATSTLSYGFTAIEDLRRHGCDAALIVNVAHGHRLERLSNVGIPTCVNVDGAEWERGKWGSVARYLFVRGARLTARYANCLIMDSEALRPLWRERFGRDGKFIPYGAPVLENVGVDRLAEEGITPGTYILAVARVVPENNIDLLLDAVDLMRVQRAVVIVGDGNYQHSTVSRLRALPENSNIRWLGHINDQRLLNQLWAHSGVYWHGHSVGGTNPALLQALGAGAPTLALDTPYNREVIQREDQLVQHCSRKLANAIEDMLDSKESRVALSKRGKSIISERYAWNDVNESYEQILTSLIGSDKRI